MPTTAKRTLGVRDHSRDSAGLEYVYPVVSRRAGGVSIGINLNPNNACNWRCVYCQVPDLKRGSAPPIDLAKLEAELRGFLRDLFESDFLVRNVPVEARRINDIAISGNGEPTSAAGFERIVARIVAIRDHFHAARGLKVVLITNGSLVRRASVQRGLELLAGAGGEVWFKIDSATKDGIARINNVDTNPASILKNLLLTAARCPTYIQTCLFMQNGEGPGEREQTAYLALLESALQQGANLKGVFFYGLARPSLQAEAPRLQALPQSWMQEYADRVAALGFTVKLVD